MVSSKSLLLPDDPITKMCGQRPRFERVLLYGIEAELNLFNIMTFCVIDLASQNKIAAVRQFVAALSVNGCGRMLLVLRLTYAVVVAHRCRLSDATSSISWL